MCIISFEKQNAFININKTKNFSRYTKLDSQLIVYSLSIATNSATAMRLPIPVEANTEENAVKFIDIQSFYNFSETDIYLGDTV